MYFRAQKKAAGDVSLSESIDSDGEGNSLSFMDVVSEEDDLLERISDEESSRALRRCMRDCLNQREREIIIKRYGFDGGIPLTQRETAELMGISRSYVSRIEKKAIERLRSGMSGEL